MRIIYCAIPTCDWEPDFSLHLGMQYRKLKEHWIDFHHFRPSREANAMSALENMFTLLDNYIQKAMEWPAVQEPEDPWSTEPLETLRRKDELAKAKSTAAGRGVAECITLLMQPRFSTADEVIGFAVSRYQAIKAGQEPVPYGQVDKCEHGLHKVNCGTCNPEPAPATVVTQAPEKTQRVLTDEERVRIVAARDAEFDISELARMFKLTREEIMAL